MSALPSAAFVKISLLIIQMLLQIKDGLKNILVRYLMYL
jgi:hypothetical protein